ncbi:hypothetical protein N7495_008462 [Penicillium taxi]|uniref:uncharacterized protein n=1 Tax=Penicillium taxi TaxID=168475 RepID=UPI0025452BD8|nr:uncharacterized protein N7495_008462 [Penicillium taxi]KAJ5888421.1 hypothetical protein N7495_008462 [Penicillium taxi]
MPFGLKRTSNFSKLYPYRASRASRRRMHHVSRRHPNLFKYTGHNKHVSEGSWESFKEWTHKPVVSHATLIDYRIKFDLAHQQPTQRPTDFHQHLLSYEKFFEEQSEKHRSEVNFSKLLPELRNAILSERSEEPSPRLRHHPSKRGRLATR